MLSRIYTGSLHGVDGFPVIVETDLLQGLPSLTLVGLAGATVKEAKERIRSAVVNCGYTFPPKRITINLSPANAKKEGSHFDLPMAMGLLVSMGALKPEAVNGVAFLGELSLDGSLNPVQGVLPLVLGLAKNGFQKVVVPLGNGEEASLVRQVRIYEAKTLQEILLWMRDGGRPPIYEKSQDTVNAKRAETAYREDFAEVAGQEPAKRAITVAVAGAHGLCMIGFPGTGKTMLARRIPTIMPKMSYEEQLEVTKLYSIAGQLWKSRGLISERPFRAPHHSISSAGLMGGGTRPTPGEFSLAHCGVLFLDELPEFSAHSLEMLRQPLEDGEVTIGRAWGSFRFPGQVMLVAAGNPCKCGYSGDETHRCICTPASVVAYRGKFSGPLLDRIDIHLEIPAVRYRDVADQGKRHGKGMGSSEMREQVERAREVQRRRYGWNEIIWNSAMNPALIKEYCRPDEEGCRLLEQAFQRLALSPRSYSTVLKVARTIADLENCSQIGAGHLAEALQYRRTEQFYGRE